MRGWPYPPRSSRSSATRLVAAAGLAAAAVAIAIVVFTNQTGTSSHSNAGGSSPPTAADTLATGPLETATGESAPASTAADPNVQETRAVRVVGKPLVKWPTFGVDPGVRQQIPEIDGESFDGTKVSVKPGRPTLIVVIAHWSADSRRSLPPLIEWAQGERSDIDVVVVSTQVKSWEPNYPPSKLFAGSKFPFPVLADSADSAAAKALGFNGVPFNVIVGADGRVLERFVGDLTLGVLYSEIPNALKG